MNPATYIDRMPQFHNSVDWDRRTGQLPEGDRRAPINDGMPPVAVEQRSGKILNTIYFSICRILFTTILVSLTLTRLCATTTYAVVDLGTFGGDGSIAYAINNSGQTVGSSATPGGSFNAFLYGNGVMQNLGTLGGPSSNAYGINDAGQVVGGSQGADNQNYAFLYDNGTMQQLNIPGTGNTEALDINNSGQIVGHWGTLAFSYEGGVLSSFGGFGGLTVASSVNAGGQIVGYSFLPGGAGVHPFLFENGNITDLGTLGGTVALARDNNDGGMVAGYSYIAGDTVPHAFLYVGGTMVDLGTLGASSSEAFGLNNNGQVVGRSETGGETHGFLYSGGIMIDLNNFIDPAAGIVVTSGLSINQAGQIVGYGTVPGGEVHALLLTPVPEPSALVFFGSGLLLLNLIRQKQRSEI